MSLKATEVGKIFNYATSFDLSGNTALELKFTDPDGTVTSFTKLTTPAVSAPATPTTDPVLGTLAASTYMQLTTDASTFTVVGTWTVCGVYTDGTPKVFHGDSATFTVESACS